MSSVWTEEFFATVAEEYAGGARPSDIALRHGLTRIQVTTKLQREGLARSVEQAAALPSDIWTVERVALLRELWPTGTPAPQIAARLSELPGPSLSRHAVVSKRDRLGLPVRSRAVRDSNSQRARKARAPSVRRNPHASAGLNMKGAKSGGPPAVVFGAVSPGPKKPFHGRPGAFSPLPGIEPVPWTSRAAGRCAWPIDVSGHDEQHSCGAPAGLNTYCGHHLRVRRDKAASNGAAMSMAGAGARPGSRT